MSSNEFRVRRKTVGRLCGCSIAGVVVAAGLLLWYSNRPRRLLDIATVALKFDTASEYSEDYYLLLNDKTALVLYRAQEWQAFIYSSQTGGKSPAAQLAQTINRFPDGPRFPCSAPDGKWLAWYTDGNIYACTTDGKNNIEVNQPSKCYYCWTQDSQNLIQLFRNTEDDTITEAAATSVSGQHKRVTFKIPRAVQLRQEPMAVISNDRVIVAIGDEKDDCPEFAVENIRSETPLVNSFHYNLPAESTWQEAAISPNGDRVCWLVEEAERQDLLSLLRQHIPQIRIGKGSKWSIWISRLNGMDTKEIGYIDAIDNNIPAISDVKWSPSGKRIAFRYDGQLWTIPIDN